MKPQKISWKEIIEKKYWKDYIEALIKLWENVQHWLIEWIVDSPKWEKQECEYFFWYEYVDQSCWICGDDYYGDMYYPLNDGKFIKVNYTC